MKVFGVVVVLPASGALAAKLLNTNEAERLELKLYDFPCAESALHTCACQMRCEDRRRCAKALEVCGRYDQCQYVLMNPSGDWATLKRGANDKERQELLGFEEKDWDVARLDDERKRLEKEGARWRTKYQRLGSALLANRTEALLATLRNDDLCGKKAMAVVEDNNGARSLVTTLRRRRRRRRRRTRRLSSFFPSDADSDSDSDSDEAASVSIALVALSYRTPATLRRSVRSWLEAGLLHVVDERVALLNDPTPAEVAICLRHGFDVKRPRDLIEAQGPPPSHQRQQRRKRSNETHRALPFLRTVKRDVFTIGAAFAASLVTTSSKYVLFLEKDFAMDDAMKQSHVVDELATSILMLKRGAALVRLRSIKDQGCGTFRRCEKDANMPNWRGRTTFERRRNWWSFYCKDFQQPPDARADVADCAVGSPALAKGLHFRCFTSWDSNWSLNAVVVDRLRALTERWKARPLGRRPTPFDAPLGGQTLADYAAQTWNKQDGFEVGMLKDDWGRLRMPLCLSLRGLFRHVEVDG